MAKQFTLYSADAYSELCQESKMKLFQSVTIRQKALSWMFIKVQNTPLFSKP